MKYITLQQIKQHDPCADQFRKARRLFGKRKRIAVTVALAVKVAPLFDWRWLSNKLLNSTARRAYAEALATAQRAYDEATVPAQRAYDEALAPAQRAYDEATARAYLSM